jgi:hypothetical protein
MTSETLTPDQHVRPNDNIAVPMETNVTKVNSLSELEKLKDQVRSARNLDVGFETSHFNIDEALDMVMQLDKYTKISVLNSVRFFLNMQCIRQALRILPQEGIEKTAEGRDQYDHLIEFTMQEYEKAGDYAPKLPAFMALNEMIRTTMYDDNLEPSSMDDTLAFMSRNQPKKEDFEADYEARLQQGQRPGISKREFCEMQLQDALRQQESLVERGQAAIQFCHDLNVSPDRGYKDLPDWAVDTIYNKVVDKLAFRWAKLDIRRTGPRISPNDRTEAEADQTLIEFVYEALTGRKMATEY